MDFFVYLVFRFFVAVVWLVPIRVLYFISDFFFFMLYYITGYRKKVVFQNLRNSFPEKSEEEIRRIGQKFYRHLADIFTESLKAFSMKEEDVVKRFVFRPSSDLERYYKAGKSVIIVAGHYNNWEWPGIAAGSQMFHKPVGFYKPMSNRYIDDYVKKSRVRGRSKLVSITNTAEVFKTDWHEPAAFYMIADQSPSSVRLAYWVNFMNQESAVLHGPEKYARVYNMPIVFCYAKKIRKGNYEAEFTTLCEDPSKTKTGEITAKFMQMLEEKILEAPEYYLWSHRRWKHKRERK
jgi:KDO2-lipid IV(A) lauroyltransferase